MLATIFVASFQGKYTEHSEALFNYHINLIIPVLISSPIFQKQKLSLEGLSDFPTSHQNQMEDQRDSSLVSLTLCTGWKGGSLMSVQ